MPVDVNIASAIKEQLEDNFGLRPIGLEASSYSTILSMRRGQRPRRVWLQSYVFDLDGGDHVRVDVLEGKVYLPGCGGSRKWLIDAAKGVRL